MPYSLVMPMALKVYVVYEHGPDCRPFGSAYLRLLRPLSHPTLRDRICLTASWRYDGEPADVVIVDRLWRADIDREMAASLTRRIRRTGARFIYALDDDLLGLYDQQRSPRAQGYRQVIQFFLEEADGVLVTTSALQNRYQVLNPRCVVVPNALDERLLAGGRLTPGLSPFERRPTIIGYMGTMTHEADLNLILPAWQTLYNRYGHAVEFQIVGVTARHEALAGSGLPIRVVQPRPEEVEYPLFMLWFTSRLAWDIAVSPLAETPFNRCKSDIKYLDYCALGAAGVFSQVPAYRGSVRHLETGWLADNTVDAWVTALERLLHDEALRMSLARAARQDLYSRRLLCHTAPRWLEALEQLLA